MIADVPKWFAVLYWMLEKVDNAGSNVAHWTMFRYSLRDRYCSCDQCKKRRSKFFVDNREAL